jgi:hypothetical protein
MSEIQSVVNSLLVRAAKTDPIMVSILQEILDELDRIGVIVDPTPEVAAKISDVTRDIPDSVLAVNYTLTPTNVILTWDAPTVDFVFYEVRKGISWDSAERLLVTSNLQVILDPVEVGTHTYLVKTLSTDQQYSTDTASVTFTVPDIGAVLITPSIIDQNILLRWTIPSLTFKIDHYIVTRNGVNFSIARSNFHVITETAGGEYTYGIIPVDIAGNEGPESIVNLLIADPADFILYATQTSDFSGTKDNAVQDGGRLLVPVDTTTTYEDHFLNNTWDSPQDQIDAGYPRWIQPTAETAYYEQIFDFGVIFSSVIVSLNWVFEIVEGEFTFGLDADVSDDNVSYSGDYNTQNFFVPSLRYLRVRINFTGSDDKALMWFYNFTASLSVREEMDSGSVIADESDPDGTIVEFNKAFYDVTSITVAVKSTKEPIDAIYQFDDVPNPTEFAVFAYDFAGNRVTKQVDWKARGII